MRNYNIESDLKQEQFQTLKLVQGDRGNKIKINVYEDGQPVSLTGCSVTAKYKRADGEIINDGVIENIHDNSFDAVMDSSITKVAGTLKMLFTIEKDAVKVSAFLLLADVREGIGESSSSGGSAGGGEVTVDLSDYYKKIETYSRKEIDAQFKDIANKLDNITVTGGGLSYTAKKAILDLFGAVAYYNKDIANTYQILKDALLVAVDSIVLDKTELTFTSATSQTLVATKSPAESEGTLVWTSNNTNVATVDNNGVVTATGNGECTITVTCGSVYATCNVAVSGVLATYSITNNLTNVTTSNNMDKIAEKTGYIATLTANSNYVISSVTVTMGEKDITSSAYSNGSISISNVTGNIVITAIAVEDVGWISGVPYDITWKEGYIVNGNEETENASFATSDFLPCHGANRLSTYDSKVYFYDKSKNYLSTSETSFVPDEKNLHIPDNAYYVRVNKRVTNTTATLTPHLDDLLTDSTSYNTDKFYRLNWKDGHNINSSTGEETEATGMSVSDFSLCYGATSLQISYGGRMFISYYDGNKNFIEQKTRQNATTASSISENAKYFRLSVANLTANFWIKLN